MHETYSTPQPPGWGPPCAKGPEVHKALQHVNPPPQPLPLLFFFMCICARLCVRVGMCACGHVWGGLSLNVGHPSVLISVSFSLVSGASFKHPLWRVHKSTFTLPPLRFLEYSTVLRQESAQDKTPSNSTQIAQKCCKTVSLAKFITGSIGSTAIVHYVVLRVILRIFILIHLPVLYLCSLHTRQQLLGNN